MNKVAVARETTSFICTSSKCMHLRVPQTVQITIQYLLKLEVKVMYIFVCIYVMGFEFLLLKKKQNNRNCRKLTNFEVHKEMYTEQPLYFNFVIFSALF